MYSRSICLAVADDLSAIADPSARVITARRAASSAGSVVSRAHPKIISDEAVTRGSQVAACEQQVTA
jgi:hypothetical protein